MPTLALSAAAIRSAQRAGAGKQDTPERHLLVLT
jgi:hypothetical protein